MYVVAENVYLFIYETQDLEFLNISLYIDFQIKKIRVKIFAQVPQLRIKNSLLIYNLTFLYTYKMNEHHI